MLDALVAEACLVSAEGDLVLVNRDWRAFALANHADMSRVTEGANYLQVCDSALGEGSEDARRFAEGLRGVLQGRMPVFALEYACHSETQRRWFVAHARPLEVAGGRFALVVHQSVTDRMLARISVEEAQGRLRHVMDAVPDILYELDLQGRLVDWNRALESVTGYRHGELSGRLATDFFVEEDRPAIMEAVREKLRAGYSRAEGRLRAKDGRLLLYQWVGSALRDAQGKLLGATGVGRDITAQRQAEERVRHSEAMLAEAQEIAHLGSWEWGVVEERLVWSAEMYRILGQDPMAFTPSLEGYLAQVHDEDLSQVRHVLEESLWGRGPLEVEHRIQRPDGSIRIVLARGRVVEVHGEHVVRMIGTVQDLTEVRAMDRKLRIQVEELKELDRLKGAFVNSVTHELRTPLTSIMGFAEFLEDEIGGPLTPEQHQFVQELQRGAKRLENLLNDLLDFARLEAGRFTLTICEGDLAAKIREGVDSLRPQASAAKVTLSLDLPESLVIAMDHQRIGQVIINLIGNAIKFTPEGGTILIRACSGPDRVCCEVIDSGVGVAPEDLPKLFRRFMQLEPGIRSGSGAGLGLSISKSIVDAHGGQIGVESEPGKGCMFWFCLPRQVPNPE